MVSENIGPHQRRRRLLGGSGIPKAVVLLLMGRYEVPEVSNGAIRVFRSRLRAVLARWKHSGPTAFAAQTGRFVDRGGDPS